MVEVDEVLGYLTTFALIDTQNDAFSNAFCNESDVPTEIEAILHGHTYPLASFWRVSVRRVSSKKDALVGMKISTDSLANLKASVADARPFSYISTWTYFVSGK